MEAIYARIEQRLSETDQNPTAVSKAAGKPDAIRNIQRAIEEGKDGSVKLNTLLALAVPLKTDPKWLIFGSDKPGQAISAVNENELTALLEAVHGVFLMMGQTEEEASALLKIALQAAQEPPTPSAGSDYHRVLAEIEARKYLKLKSSGHDGA